MNSTNNRNSDAAACARDQGLPATYPIAAGLSVEKPHKNSSGTPASTVSIRKGSGGSKPQHPRPIDLRIAKFFPGTDHDMHFTIAKQIEYYFSSSSLWKNYSLREHMDEQGWVSVSVIAGFPQVEQLMKRISAKDKVQYILDAVRGSTIVETKDNMIRKCGDWMKWILPQSKDGNSTKPEMKQSYLKYQRGKETIEGTL